MASETFLYVLTLSSYFTSNLVWNVDPLLGNGSEINS
jgi:hypothetical protein